MLGDNFVRLVGVLQRARYNEYASGAKLYKATLAIAPPDNDLKQYINIGAWGDLAEQLSALPQGTLVKIQGHIEKSSYDSPCKYCNAPKTVYWFEVIVDNFSIMEDI